MHDWQEKHSADKAAWGQWYQSKLDEIVRVVESDESRRFAGEIDKLNEYLKPIKSDARISSLLSKGFYGREWLFDAVEKWRQDTIHDSRLFWIMGDPGVGKSAFAAQLTHTHGDTVIAAQFVEWDKPDHRDARRVVCSIAFQLATRLPDYRKLLLTLPEIAELDRKDASELFDYLLANPLRSVINGGRERHLIVIDALDEAGESGRNPLVEMLARNAHHLPTWLGIVVTSRPEFDVKTPFQALNPFPLDTKSESNKADIRDYLRRELASPLQSRPDADRLVEQILEKSEGVFLYVERFCDDIQHHHFSLDHPKQFPQGISGIFYQYFQRKFTDLEKFRKDVRPALCVILAAREPLPVEILQRLFKWQDEELRDFTRPLGSLFPVTKDANTKVIKPYHKSITDWLADEANAIEYFASLKEGHCHIANNGWNWLQAQQSDVPLYLIRNLPVHLIEAGNQREFCQLLENPNYAEAVKTCGEIARLLKFCDEITSSDENMTWHRRPVPHPNYFLSFLFRVLRVREVINAHGLNAEQCRLVNRWMNSTIESRLARELYESYILSMVKSSNWTVDFPHWNQLKSESPLNRGYYWDVAEGLIQMLRRLGYTIIETNEPMQTPLKLAEQEVEVLAMEEHERWCKERESLGWTYGEIKDRDNRKTPNLVGWNALHDKLKQYDREAILMLITTFDRIGCRIVKQSPSNHRNKALPSG